MLQLLTRSPLQLQGVDLNDQTCN